MAEEPKTLPEAKKELMQDPKFERQIEKMDKITAEYAVPEAFKEFFRVIVIAVIPVVLEALTQSEVSWRSVSVAVFIAILKALDSWLHDKSKELPKTQQGGILKSGGLTGF